MTKIYSARRAFLLGAGATALIAGLPRGTYAQGDTPPLNFGFQNTSWGTIGMVAESQDLFKKAGANVAIHKFDSGKTTRDAMIAGRIDIGVIGATPFIVGAAKGELTAIGVALYGAKTQSIVAGGKSGLKNVADLKGRRVGTQLGSATDYVFQNKILPAFGLSKSDVQIVNVQFQNHLSAMVAGSVDAFAGVEPFPSIAQDEDLGRVLVDYRRFDLQPIILAANRSVVENRRADVVAFMRGWTAGVMLCKERRAQAVAIVYKHFKDQGFTVSEHAIGLMLTKLDINTEFIPELGPYLTEQAQVLVEQKNIDAVPDWSRILNPDLLQAAAS